MAVVPDRVSRLLHAALAGVLLLWLLMLPLVRAHLGYPMRLVTSIVVTPLLHLGGFAVLREDTSLHWQGQEFVVAAECSGVGKLWAGLCLATALALLRRLDAQRTLLVLLAAVPAVIAGNALRVAALFLLEMRLRPYPAWQHDGVGVAAFAMTALLIVAAVRLLASAQVPVNELKDPLPV
jgi:exosortase